MNHETQESDWETFGSLRLIFGLIDVNILAANLNLNTMTIKTTLPA
jgi:hypothetical protein